MKLILKSIGIALVIMPFYQINEWEWWALAIGLNFIVNLDNIK